MSSKNTRASNMTEDESSDLILKLKELLPQLKRGSISTVKASKILKETCSYIKRLHEKIDDLSEKLSQLADSVDSAGVDSLIVTTFLRQ